MAEEIRFIDPAFRCEVVLNGMASALYAEGASQFERLRGIKCLGLMAHIHDVGIHHRHQHLVGMMRIFNKLCQQPKKKGLPKEFVWSFWVRLVYGQTGHAAFSYDSEKAVLLACHMEPALARELMELLKPVVDAQKDCVKCELKESATCKGAGRANQWLTELVSKNQWRRLHLWIAALKLLHNPALLKILNGQSGGTKNELGFSEAEALRFMTSPDCRWNTAFTNLECLDSVVRDLTLAGTVGIQFDVDNLISVANLPHPDWGLLRSLNTYLFETLYESVEAQTVSVLYQRALAALLIKRRVTLDGLFGITLQKQLDDDTLRKVLEHTTAGREVFDTGVRRAWKAWTVKAHVPEDALPSEEAKKVTGHDKGFLAAHTRTRCTCFKMGQSGTLGLALCHQSVDRRPDARAFVKLCRSVLQRKYPRLEPSDLTSFLFEGLLDKSCHYGLQQASEYLSAFTTPGKTLRSVAEIVKHRMTAGDKSTLGFSLKIAGVDYPMLNNPQACVIYLMHAAIAGDDKAVQEIGMTTKRAAMLLWEQILSWQSLYLGLRPAKTLITLISDTQRALAERAMAHKEDAATALEFYALLEALRSPSDAVSFRVSVPNLKLLRPDNNVENEYDVVSIVLKNDKDVEVWVWGVTIAEDLKPKRTEDMAKIHLLKDLLGRRWGTDVRVVTCYVHRYDKGICCEIDGVQDRRPFTAGDVSPSTPPLAAMLE